MTPIELPRGSRGAFSTQANQSCTLPSRYYLDAELHRQELQRIFHRSWCYLGHVSQIPNPGDYCVDQIADQCVFLLRIDRDRMRAFFNVCQHRGHRLFREQGNTGKRIVCPYHAWTYALDGSLAHAPHTGRLENFDPAEFGLREIALANCGGLLFGNLDAEANYFVAEYDGLEGTFSAALPDLPGFATAERLDYAIAANWKVVVDNFSEGYHIPVAHKRLSQVLDNQASILSIVESGFAYFQSQSKAGYAGLELEPGEPYHSWTIWPNTCVLSQPGCANLIVLRMAPNGPTGCAERVDILSPEGKTNARFDAIRALFAENFNREDIAIVESVQRGLQSLGYDQGRYVADASESWYTESGLHRFHLRILEALG